MPSLINCVFPRPTSKISCRIEGKAGFVGVYDASTSKSSEQLLEILKGASGAHAAAMTAGENEACSICYGRGREFAVEKVPQS